jgi:hypothetical protein
MAVTRYFTKDGRYLGAFDVSDEDLPSLLPDGAIEVPQPPEHISQQWEGTAWSQPPQTPLPVEFALILERLAPEEHAKVRSLVTSDDRFFMWWGRALAQGYVNLNSPEIAQAKHALVQAGLFTPERLAELFAP